MWRRREGRSFDKRYLVLVRGKWELGKKRIDAPLRTDTRVGGERTVQGRCRDGKEAASEFRVVQFFGSLATLLEVQLLTGRTHQIRVHAAYAGHPVAGDEKYGDEEFNRQLQRVRADAPVPARAQRQLRGSGAPCAGEHQCAAAAGAARRGGCARPRGAGRLKPAGCREDPVAASPRACVRPARPAGAAPRKARSAAGRSAPSGRGSRSTRTRSRRGPRT